MRPLILVLIFVSGFAVGQDKPRVFVQGKGSQDVNSSGAGGGGRHWGTWGSNSTIDSHDEGMEVTKNLQKECSGVIVTLFPPMPRLLLQRPLPLLPPRCHHPRLRQQSLSRYRRVTFRRLQPTDRRPPGLRSIKARV